MENTLILFLPILILSLMVGFLTPPELYRHTPSSMFSIARNTFKEIFRDKVLLVILLFGVLFVLSTLVLEKISYQSSSKMAVDFGLGFIALFTIIIAFFSGSSLIYREMEQKTILLLFSKPVSRTNFILGKFFGLSAILLMIVVGLSLLFVGTLALKGVAFTYALFQALVLTYMMGLFILSSILFFSSLASPLITIFASFLLFISGSAMPFIQEFARRKDDFFVDVLAYLYYVVPNFGIFNIADAAAYNVTLTPLQFGTALAYGVVYSAFFLFLTVLIFRKKEIV